MARACSICAHEERAAIDAALQEGGGLDTVAAHFGVSRSALHRHRASHLGRAVTFHLPPAASPPVSVPAPEPEASCPAPPALAPDADAAELARLFDRAREAEGQRTIQEYTSLVMDGLAHAYASANRAGDTGTAVRALRELRGMLTFHAATPAERLKDHVGWRERPQTLRGGTMLSHMLAHILSPQAGAWGSDPDETREAALAGIALEHPEFAASLAEIDP